MTPSRRPGRWWRAFRLAATGLVVLCAVVAGAGPAAAHAQLIGTDPADGAVLEEAPEAVTLSFNEPVRLTDREITVYDAAGRAIESEATSSGTDVVVDLPDDPGRGTFVVAWFVLSGDGHPISGSLTFSVGERSATVSEPPPPPTSSPVVTVAHGVLGGVMYVGLLVASGLAAFVALVLPPSFAGERVRRRIRDLVRATAWAAAGAAVLLVPVSAAYAQGEEVTDVVTGFDPALVVDEMVSALLLLAGLAVVVVTLTDAGPRDRAAQRLLVGGAALAAVSPAVVGPTRSYEPTPLLLLADAVHLLAGAAWLGGLVGMVLALPALSGRERLAAETLARFSVLAGGLLAAVAAAGAVLGWRILGSWSAFVDTPYGVLLPLKIGLALVVAGIGAWNRFVLLPRVSGAAVFDDRTRAAGTVNRTMSVEVTILVLLLGVTGFLVNQSPRPVPVDVPPGQTGIEEEALGDYEVYAGLTPRRAGRNTLLVQVQDAAGEPVTPPRPPVVEVRSGAVDLGEVRLSETGVGTYEAPVVLPRPGRWEVQVALRLSRFESPVTTLRFDVPAAGGG